MTCVFLVGLYREEIAFTDKYIGDLLAVLEESSQAAIHW